MSSQPTTPNTTTPPPLPTTTTLPVSATVASAEKTHGIAIDEPSASFLISFSKYIHLGFVYV